MIKLSIDANVINVRSYFIPVFYNFGVIKNYYNIACELKTFAIKLNHNFSRLEIYNYQLDQKFTTINFNKDLTKLLIIKCTFIKIVDGVEITRPKEPNVLNQPYLTSTVETCLKTLCEKL
jgi:hypothetical protein